MVSICGKLALIPLQLLPGYFLLQLDIDWWHIVNELHGALLRLDWPHIPTGYPAMVLLVQQRLLLRLPLLLNLKLRFECLTVPLHF